MFPENSLPEERIFLRIPSPSGRVRVGFSFKKKPINDEIFVSYAPGVMKITISYY